MKQKKKKIKDHNINQKSYYFEDYFETHKKNKQDNNSNISQDRIYILIVIFISLLVNLSAEL